MSLVRSLAGSMVKPLAAAIVGSGSGSDLAADVRALFSANGGDFTGTMLDFTKTSRLYSDFEGTEAAAESTLALVLDDQQDGALGAVTSTTSWSNVLSTFDVFTDNGNGSFSAEKTSAGGNDAASSGQTISVSAGDWVRVEYTVDAVSGSGFLLRLFESGTLNSRSSPISVPTSPGTYVAYLQVSNDEVNASVSFVTTSLLSITASNVSAARVTGNHAYQTSAGSRPLSTTDAFGTRVAQPDGTDDRMDLPAAVLDTASDYMYAFAAYSIDVAGSDTSATVMRGDVTNGGFSPRHSSTTGEAQLLTTDGGGAGSATITYGRALSSNETIVRTDATEPGSGTFVRINGVEVVSGSAFATQDVGGGTTIFGNNTSESLAGTCHGIVVLTGSRAMTAAEIATVEAYLADLAFDTLLTADPDTVLSRPFRPETDLNVTEGFATADWTDSSAGSSSITVNAGSNVTFNVVGADAAIADRTFRTRVGFRYTITSTSSAGVTVSADESTAGGTTYGTGASISFVATTSTVYVRASTTTNADTLTALAISESPATGDYWDMLDPTKRFTDAGSTQAGANQQVQQVNSVEGDYPLTQTTSADQATLDGTATNLVFDGSTDFYVATDATDDLVQTGDTTELWAVTPDVSASARVISSAGDSTVATDTASVFSINGSDQLSLQQADASNTETEATAITVTEGAVNVISFVRDGASVVFGIGADEVETETFATVTTPTAGTSPAFNLGISVDQSSGPYDGSIQAGLKLDRALSTGLTIHAIRALEEKTA